MCAEEVLRLNHKVEYEEGSRFGSRQNRALIPMDEDDCKRFDVAMENTARDDMPFSVQLIKNDIPKEDTAAYRELSRNDLAWSRSIFLMDVGVFLHHLKQRFALILVQRETKNLLAATLQIDFIELLTK